MCVCEKNLYRKTVDTCLQFNVQTWGFDVDLRVDLDARYRHREEMRRGFQRSARSAEFRVEGEDVSVCRRGESPQGDDRRGARRGEKEGARETNQKGEREVAVSKTHGGCGSVWRYGTTLAGLQSNSI